MNVGRIHIESSDLKQLTDFLKNKFPVRYINEGDNMTIMAFEEYYFRNGGIQMNTVIAKKEGLHILVESIGGGGGVGIFNIRGSLKTKNS